MCCLKRYSCAGHDRGPDPVAQHLEIVDSGGAIELRRKDIPPSIGFIFYPGAEVDPVVYVRKLSKLVEQSYVTVFISKPLLNLPSSASATHCVSKRVPWHL